MKNIGDDVTTYKLTVDLDLSHYAFSELEDVLLDMSDDFQTGILKTAERTAIIRYHFGEDEVVNKARTLYWDNPPAIVGLASIQQFFNCQHLKTQEYVCEVYDSDKGRYISLDDTTVVSFPVNVNEMLLDVRLTRRSDYRLKPFVNVRSPSFNVETWVHHFDRSFVVNQTFEDAAAELCSKPRAVVFQQTEMEIGRAQAL
eukprot:7283909-Pyramimonas_sp.AAC.1